jgi:hypothetical protein
VQVTFEDNSTTLIYANRLNNENLNKWQGWQCSVGVTGINIYKDEIYSGECRNDWLGSFSTGWNLLENPTICKLERCTGCTTDLMQHKWKP